MDAKDYSSNGKTIAWIKTYRKEYMLLLTASNGSKDLRQTPKRTLLMIKIKNLTTYRRRFFIVYFRVRFKQSFFDRCHFVIILIALIGEQLNTL